MTAVVVCDFEERRLLETYSGFLVTVHSEDLGCTATRRFYKGDPESDFKSAKEYADSTGSVVAIGITCDLFWKDFGGELKAV